MPATAPTQADPPLDQAPGSSGETSLKLAKGVSLTFEDDSLIVKGMGLQCLPPAPIGVFYDTLMLTRDD